jgi:hypothetical protein
MTQLLYLPTAAEAGIIATAIPATTDPQLGALRCPNGHDSASLRDVLHSCSGPVTTTTQRRHGTSSA